ncbi:helix-turn-helix transcriptional regulator [Paenibacillus qinlingensis]|uniref:Transcriptional regulator with XRE-family HTH domain n=1 Tax=Paenibacillus qinlingensis TaxID=1837343 RepID=A0ABU1P209_9BACL|nr:helix-turn-helix transcriptional regulator [Paenibacillus qinlingensis]MDR6553775.1 transcriptional regulator with XRE-family HTH domain [Paenibacillus qinlingensis]
MEANNHFGKFLETLRGKASLRKAANKSGLSHAYIRDLELGRNRTTNDVIKPSPETLRKLAQAYQYPYTDLLKKAGYLEETSTWSKPAEVNLDNIWYVEFGIQSILYVSEDGMKEEQVESLVAFTHFIETLTERNFVKLDMHLFVNLKKIKKYAPAEGRLYFDIYDHAPYIVAAAIPQKKYHQMILDYIACNNGLAIDSSASSSACASSLKTKFFS